MNRITYSNNKITKNKSPMPLDLYIKLGPYKFSLQAAVDHHGYSMNSGHYTASINCCAKTFHCNNNEITENYCIQSSDKIKFIRVVSYHTVKFVIKTLICLKLRRNINVYLSLISFLPTDTTQVVGKFPRWRPKPILHNKQHACWCPGDLRSQGINSIDIGLIKPY